MVAPIKIGRCHICKDETEHAYQGSVDTRGRYRPELKHPNAYRCRGCGVVRNDKRLEAP